MWTETLKMARADPTVAELPGCNQKVARSIEFPWNYVTVDETRMRSLADAVAKVEENLDELRHHVWRSGGLVAAFTESATLPRVTYHYRPNVSIEPCEARSIAAGQPITGAQPGFAWIDVNAAQDRPGASGEEAALLEVSLPARS